jgi:uncharacterized membrane protein YedE/YeeE
MRFSLISPSLLLTCSAFGAGLLFGIGLVVSQMINPAKVLAFLDLAGAWDPSLALVMVGALTVAGTGMFFVRRREKPVLAERFYMPEATRPGAIQIDRPLVLGAALFGIGWGLAGICPGPALATVSFGLPLNLIFLLALGAGMVIYDLPRESMKS